MPQLAHNLHYVILHHTGIDVPHIDLMFETSPDSLLATWRSDSWPLKPGSTLKSLANHRRAYLQYEGPVSNNRGNVKRVASGTHKIVEDSPRHLIVILDTSVQLILPR